jgi:uncharacterized protein YndB with AHSA1/START domain
MSSNHNVQEAIAPVVKSIVVPLPVEAAFRLFTEQVGHWWPLETHSVFGEEAVSCILEGKVGGRFYEVHKDRRQSDWGKILVWEPPHRLMLSFHPGRAPDSAQEVEITFREEGTGTRLTLTHRDWERLGERGQTMRDNYDSGWDSVLGKYVNAAYSSNK